jgi:hypothetical protein
MGTHTSDDEPNYLLIAKVQLPGEDKEPDSRIYSEDNEAGGYGNGKVTKPEAQFIPPTLHTECSALKPPEPRI